MHPILLIGGQTRDGTTHTYGMSVCRTAILHHQIHPTVSQEAVGFFFGSWVRHFACIEATWRTLESRLLLFALSQTAPEAGVMLCKLKVFPPHFPT